MPAGRIGPAGNSLPLRDCAGSVESMKGEPPDLDYEPMPSPPKHAIARSTLVTMLVLCGMATFAIGGMHLLFLVMGGC